MSNFYFTFGQKYRDEPHPKYDKANPNGWVRINASSYTEAREHAFELFGPYFSMMYDEGDFDPSYFPKGEIESIEL